RRATSLEVGTSFSTEKVGELGKREVELIYKITAYHSALSDAAKEYSPAVIAQYVYDLAKEYNGFYQEVPIFNEENKDKLAFRIALSEMTAKLINKSMELLGIEVPERM
ncbi:MAG: DALR anticodon-binding domain-containing protein, partial [Ekhidna sp.]